MLNFVKLPCVLALILVAVLSGTNGARHRTISALEILASARVVQQAIVGNLDSDGWDAQMPSDFLGNQQFEGFRNQVNLPSDNVINNDGAVGDISPAEGEADDDTTQQTTDGTYPENKEECREPAIEEFPTDLFTKSELQSGWIAIHITVTMYLFYALAIICDDYFVPSVEITAKVLKIPSEVAGCTILGISNSSPELFTNIIATFIAQGDLGISSIVGASVFNVLAVAASVGIICRKTGAKIEWYPLTRDSLVYVISVGVLALILRNNHVEWYDGVLLVLLYCVYIVIIIFNKRIHNGVKRLIRRIRKARFQRNPNVETIRKSISPVSTCNSLNSVLSTPDEFDEDLDSVQPIPDEFDGPTMPLCVLPIGESWLTWVQFIIGWPIRLVYKVTVPDCKILSVRNWYPLTLVMCLVWNTILCYMLGWMVTVIGWTFGIPDTITGMTLFAIGTSVPQAVSSIIVARRGMGTMAMNNAIGSNIFNILVCLGIPWLIQTLILASDSSTNERYVVISSRALGYTAFILIACMVGLYIIIAANKFVIDLRIGLVAMVGYFVVISIASLFELNVFMYINPPICTSL